MASNEPFGSASSPSPRQSGAPRTSEGNDRARTAENDLLRRVPPHSPEAEQAVLGGILMRPQLMHVIVDLIADTDFYLPAHATIFRAFLDLYRKSAPIDLISTAEQLKSNNALEEAGGAVYLADLAQAVVSGANAEYYATIVRFSTYGVPMISGEIRRYLRDNSPIRVSRSTRDTAYQVLQEKERLTAATGREPSLDEIAKSLGLPRQTVVFALDAISDPISLYEPIYTDSGESICVMDQVGDTKNTDEQWLERLALSSAMGTLNAREKKILSLRFYAGKTQMEVAGEIGISQAQVSRLEKQAIGKIRCSVFPS